MSKLAILGGPAAVNCDAGDTFVWPIVTPEHEEATLQVLRRGAMSGTDVTMEFEREYAKATGMRHALACNNGTSAIHCALFGMGIGVGDEVICPSLTYWASVLQLYSLGATPVFADVDPETLCLDPADVARRVTPRTKAVIVVHYAGMMADMDGIMAVAKERKLKVFEDCSHAHFCLYKGRQAGTFGDASGFSLMSGKAFAIGEAGIMLTNDQEILERAILFGHYERHGSLELEATRKFAGLPCGGHKYRTHQLSSAFGLVQLRHYQRQFAEIDQAMNSFCDLLDDLPGVKPIRPAKGSGSTKGGWYFPLAHYRPEQLGGLSVGRFVEALAGEGVKNVGAGCNKPLHTHALFNSMDIYGHGRPTRLANLPAGTVVADLQKPLPATDKVNARSLQLPWFRRNRPELVEQYAAAFRKVVENHRDLLPGDVQTTVEGGYSNTFKKK